MASVARVVTVAVTPTILTANQSDATPGTSIAVYVPVGGATVFVGGAAVTASTGYPCFAGTEHFFDLDPTDNPRLLTSAVRPTSESLYGIVVASTQPVNVLQTGA